MRQTFFNHEVLRLLVGLATKLASNNTGAEGGYFCWAHEPQASSDSTIPQSPPFLPQLRFAGKVPTEKLTGRARNAFMKVIALAENSNQLLSLELRNVQKNVYGGGIRYNKTLCSFSGFPEEIDEAICLIFCAWGEFSNLKQIQKPNEESRKFILKKAKEICPNNEQVQPLLTKWLELVAA